MIIDESKSRLLNNDEESEETVNIPLIMRSHPFLHRIHNTEINSTADSFASLYILFIYRQTNINLQSCALTYALQVHCGL
jgi:hypothetical protein